MKKSAIVQRLVSVSLFLFLLLFTTTLSAQAKLSVQGLLKKSDGTSLSDGNYDLTFRFYDAEIGGAALEAVTVNTEVNGGVYSAVLSGFTNLTFAVPYYVSVAVNGGTELLPRIALTAAPYAISLQGQNNKFPSIGLVEADAIDVAGAVNAGSVSAGSISATGNVSGANLTTAGNVSAATVSATGNIGGASLSASGAVSGASVSATGAVSGARMLVPGGAPAAGVANAGYSFGSGGDQDGGMFSLGDNNVALYANGVKALEANNGGVIVPGYLRSGQGYAFTNDDDSGMFSPQDGRLYFRVNGQLVAQFDQPTPYTNNQTVGSSVRFFGVQKGPDNPQVEWDEVTGQLQVDNSSRKYKRNIQPLRDDFTLILKAQPKLYNRVGYPDDLFEAGYIAEEFDSIGLTRLVHYNGKGEIVGINYKKISIYLNEIVKTQQTDIDKMKADIAALKAEKEALRAENNNLRAENGALLSNQDEFSEQLRDLSRRMRSLEMAASNR